MNKAVPIIEAIGLQQRFSDAEREVQVLRGIDLQVFAGEVLAVMGVSGSGKSTLLHLLGGLDKPVAGQVLWSGQNIQSWSLNEQSERRNQGLGFVYQFHHLLAEFNALEKISMPLLIGGYSRKDALQKSQIMLERVGLLDRASHKPSELSGGERQRIAIARALVTEPACVLLDEPTGNLDRNTALNIQALMSDLNEKLDISYIVVTHDESFADTLDRKLFLRDGMLHG